MRAATAPPLTRRRALTDWAVAFSSSSFFFRNGKGEASWKGEHVMNTSKGPVTVPTLFNANIK
jgi:hypothetical protein